MVENGAVTSLLSVVTDGFASLLTLPGDGLRRGAPLHGAIWAVPALAGHRRPAGRGSPGQRHLPGALLPVQAPPTTPTNHRGDFPRGLLVVTKANFRSHSDRFRWQLRVALSSLRGGAPTASHAPASTCWWLWLMFPSSWSGPPTWTAWLRAGTLKRDNKPASLLVHFCQGRRTILETIFFFPRSFFWQALTFYF